MTEQKYDWQPYFRELAEKLLEQKDNQKEFGEWLDENVLKAEKAQGEYWNPISIIQLFLFSNKSVLKVGKEVLAELLKDRLGMTSSIPKNVKLLEQIGTKTYIWGGRTQGCNN